MKDELRRAFDASTEAPHPSLRSALRARLEAGPAQQPPRAWRLMVASALVVGIVGLTFIAGVSLLPRGGGNLPAPATTASATPSAEPTATPLTATASPSPTASASACTGFSGGSATMANVTDVRVGTSAGYDRFVIEFDGPVPAYSVTPQPSATFMQDATGQTLQLQGSGGVKIVVRGASGTDLSGRQTFKGALDRTPGYPALKEARQLGDFERVFSWGLGLAQPDCVRVTVLAGPDRLVVDVLKP